MSNEAVYTPQPTPRAGEKRVLDEIKYFFPKDVDRSLLLDLEAKMLAGEKKYGTPLETFNGRNADLDYYQDLIDAFIYCFQSYIEDETPEAVEKVMDIRDLYHLAGRVRKRLVKQGVLTEYE